MSSTVTTPAARSLVISLGEISEPLGKALDVVGRDLRSALVDLRLLTGGRVDDREVGPRLALDPGEVVEDPLLGQLLQDPVAGGAAG